MRDDSALPCLSQWGIFISIISFSPDASRRDGTSHRSVAGLGSGGPGGRSGIFSVAQLGRAGADPQTCWYYTVLFQFIRTQRLSPSWRQHLSSSFFNIWKDLCCGMLSSSSPPNSLRNDFIILLVGRHRLHSQLHRQIFIGNLGTCVYVQIFSSPLRSFVYSHNGLSQYTAWLLTNLTAKLQTCWIEQRFSVINTAQILIQHSEVRGT